MEHVFSSTNYCCAVGEELVWSMCLVQLTTAVLLERNLYGACV